MSTSRCWDDPILGLRYDDGISKWFRTYFESDEQIDLVIFDETQFEGRPCNEKVDVPNEAQEHHIGVYHDMSPIHLCSTESLADLNRRLEKKIPIYNFRPNIILRNVEQPYSEVKSLPAPTNERKNALRLLLLLLLGLLERNASRQCETQMDLAMFTVSVADR